MGNNPVGLVVLGRELGQPTIGHVSHYYLSPAARGYGLGNLLNEHALAVLARRGMTSARLHVAPSNATAIRFYAKVGWEEVGPVPGLNVMAMTITL